MINYTCKKVLFTTALIMPLLHCVFAQLSSKEIISIPILVHVVYNNRDSKCYKAGANEQQNLARELIVAEIEDLHNDFMLMNTDTMQVLQQYKPLIANAAINFYLDTTYNLNGADRGITRTYSAKRTKWYKDKPVIENKKYLNIYIVNFTHSFSNPEPWNDSVSDALFLDYCWIGQHYRLLTHEAGHWLGLWHLWGTGSGTGDKNSCSEGDDIGDTHPQKNATHGDCERCPNDGRPNPPVDQSCNTAASNYNNFMDYSGCRKMFTIGQVNKMRENLMNHRSQMVLNSRSR